MHVPKQKTSRSSSFDCIRVPDVLVEIFASTVRSGYRVTGYNDLPGIMIGLTKIKIKTSKRHSKYHYIQCISALVIYRI